MKVLLQARNIERRYGSFTVVHDATAAIGEGMKVGVMGRNGGGKSALRRILIGEEEPDSGEVIRSRDLRLGYLARLAPWEPGEAALPFLPLRPSGGRSDCRSGRPERGRTPAPPFGDAGVR